MSPAATGQPGEVVDPDALACPACATPVLPGARFCFACGVPVDATGMASAGVAERRIVTVLFGDLSDFTSWAEDLDPERVGVVIDRMLAALTKAVADVGGSVDKLTGDGIMAVFGAPVAHDDDPARAVRAAADMQDAVRRLVADEFGGGRQLGLRVGLNTGEVLAGMQAGVAYTVVGDIVNTAARLCDAAKVGTVYAGQDTAVASAGAAIWRRLPPLRLKGKREPVTAYQLVQLRSATAPRLGLGERAPFVDREAELGRLSGRWCALVAAARPASVLVIGEAGVGKTRLVEELAGAAAEWPGARVLWGRCTPYGEGRDLTPIVDIVRTACGVHDLFAGAGGDRAALVEEATRRVRRTVAGLQPAPAGSLAWTPTGSAVAERLLALLGLAAPVESGPRSATPGSVAARRPELAAVAALVNWLSATGPILLVVDDLYSASPALLEALTWIARRLRGPVLLVAAARPALLERQSNWLAGLPAPELLRLEPFDRANATRLLRAYLGDRSLDPVSTELLLRRAEGNPYFLAEMLHLLIDRGMLRPEGTSWVLPRPDGADFGTDGVSALPAGVQAVLAARIDGLEPAVRAVLRDAAVLGTRFPTAALAALGQPIGAADPAAGTAALRVLTDRQLLRPGEDGLYRFTSKLAREVAYAGISKADRARRHAAIARWAAASDTQLPAADAFLAAHADQAVRLAAEIGLTELATDHQLRCTAFAALARLGYAALGRDDNTEAEDLLARALSLIAAPVPGFDRPSGPESAALSAPELDARIAHARALAALHRLDEAEVELAPALRPALADTDEQRRAAALIVLGDVRRRRGADDAAVAAFDSALAAAEAAGRDDLVAEALRQLGLLEYFNGRLLAAEQRFRQARELATEVGDFRGVGWALQHLAWSAVSRGDYATAEAALQAAVELFTELHDDGGLGWCAGTEALVRLLQGRLHAARGLADGLLAVGRTSGDPFGMAICLTIHALAAAELGDVAVARGEADRARQEFVAIGDSWGEAVALVAAGAAARGAGDPATAVGLLAQAIAISERDHHPLAAFLARVVAGHCELDRGDADAAERLAVAAVQALDHLDLEPAATVGGKVLQARALRARGEASAALHVLREATAAPAASPLLFPRRQALAHLAGTLHDLGRDDEALAVARRAVAEPAEDIRSRIVSLRVLGTTLCAVSRYAEALAATQAALVAARSTGQCSEIAPTERALAAVRDRAAAG